MIFGGMDTVRKAKINKLPFFLAWAFLFLSNPPPGHSKQLIIDSNDQFGFARTCMERGEYERAVGEFERFIHFFPNDTQVPTARFLMGVCYLKDRHPDKAREIFSEVIRSEPGSLLAGKALLLMGESYYEQGLMEEAEMFFRRTIDRYPFKELKNSALYRLGWARMRINKWKEASEIFGRVEKGSVLYPSSQELAKDCLEGEALPYKSPVLAGSMAAILPGAGHAYVSRYKDAAVAFLLNGLFIWAAAESFHQDHDVLGGILTFLELGWYTGNIYSAVNVTHKYNRKVRDDFRSRLKDRFGLHLFVAKKGQVGLALTFRF
jgi:TolA-binding protein